MSVPTKRVQGVVVKMLVHNEACDAFDGLISNGDDVDGVYDVVDIGNDWKKHDADHSMEDLDLIVVYTMDEYFVLKDTCYEECVIFLVSDY